MTDTLTNIWTSRAVAAKKSLSPRRTSSCLRQTDCRYPGQSWSCLFVHIYQVSLPVNTRILNIFSVVTTMYCLIKVSHASGGEDQGFAASSGIPAVCWYKNASECKYYFTHCLTLQCSSFFISDSAVEKYFICFNCCCWAGKAAVRNNFLDCTERIISQFLK